jgi:hypothetical protein
MIVFFAYDGVWLEHIYMTDKLLESKYIIMTKYNEKVFERASVIIPCGIESQIKLNKYQKFKHKFLISSLRVYNILDDKLLYYIFIKKYNILHDTNIKLIDTYDCHYNGENKFGKYIVKHKDGTGSCSNKIMEDHIYNLIKKYSKKYQIQDVLNIRYIHGVNCLFKNGKIISSLDFLTPGFITDDFYDKNNTEYLQQVQHDILKIISKIGNILLYNGLIEFEFIEDTNNMLYILEANPRMSGNILCMTDIENDNPYVRNLILPYCDLIKHRPIELKIYNDSTKLTYYGNIRVPSRIERKIID